MVSKTELLEILVVHKNKTAEIIDTSPVDDETKKLVAAITKQTTDTLIAFVSKIPD